MKNQDNPLDLTEYPVPMLKFRDDVDRKEIEEAVIAILHRPQDAP